MSDDGKLPDITPTIGRKVWYWPSKEMLAAHGVKMSQVDPDQPLDATVVLVHTDRMVNLSAHDHMGNHCPLTSVVLRQPSDPKPQGDYCEWMPYQVKQAGD